MQKQPGNKYCLEMNFLNKSFLSTVITAVILIFTSIKADAQRHEFGVFGGGSFYMGDLNPVMPFLSSRPAFGALYRLNFDKHVSVRANILRGYVRGDDALLKFNAERNLSFKSSITEISGQIEVNFKPFLPGDKKNKKTPYLFGGVGVFKFNPKAQIDGEWYRLQPLGTEGQGTEAQSDRDKYSLTSFSILFGMGYKMNLTKRLTLCFEWGMRTTTTDYLDDVSTTYPSQSALGEMNEVARILSDRSLNNQGNNATFQRGNPATNDWYSFAGIYLTYRLKDRVKYSCPTYN